MAFLRFHNLSGMMPTFTVQRKALTRYRWDET